jgi:predicted GNAT family acetyltransferase
MQVEHDPGSKRFVVHVAGHHAELAYEVSDGGALDLVHTYVPPEARGEGVADALAHEAFAYARREHKQVIATCPFVRSWLRHHPEENDLLVQAA